MTQWSADLLLCTDGPSELESAQQRELQANGVDTETAKIVALLGDAGRLEAIRFANGRTTARRALFFDTPSHPQSPFAQQLGCRLTSSGKIHCGQYEASSIPGVYAAGNILEDVQLSIVAAAEGARATATESATT